MNAGEDIDQFMMLEEKVDSLIELVTALRKEKESFAEKAQFQEEQMTELTSQLHRLRTARDEAKQRIDSLVEKIGQIGV